MKGEVVGTLEPAKGESLEWELLTVKVPRGTGIGLGAVLEMSVSGHASEQTFPHLKDGKRVVNTTQSLEERTQVFKG